MISLDRLALRSWRVTAVALLAAGALSACSGSDGTVSGDEAVPVGAGTSSDPNAFGDPATDGATGSAADGTGQGAADDVAGVATDAPSGGSAVEAPDAAAEGAAGDTSGGAGGTSPADLAGDGTADAGPQAPERVLVTFDVTVPAYMSDALQVELVWGDIVLRAEWVGDEYWSAAGELPGGTERALAVTFYDGNGAIELARHDRSLAVGSDAAQSVRVSADQFDAEAFDDDGDGVDNLTESIAGTDPLTDEDSLLEIRDSYTINGDSRMSVTRAFESHLSEERPLSGTLQPDPFVYLSPAPVSGSVDIDADGNGTLTYDAQQGINYLRLAGTRINSGDSISWEGMRRTYDGDYGHRVEFTNTVAVVDEDTRSYTEQIVGENVGTYAYRWETTTRITGTRIEGTSLCEPAFGSGSITERVNYPDRVETTTFGREPGDPYWLIVHVDEDDETSRWFARSLRVSRDGGPYGDVDADSPEDGSFICDFVDW